MTRLRYDGLATGSAGALVPLSLGGSGLTNSATAVTFSAALTSDNGTAVPTITGSDYIPLSILDASGNLAEIVWLTAYTSGATTGTIARGKEGTTGVVHASGVKVVNGPTVEDFRQIRMVAASRTAGDLTFNTTGWQDVENGLDLVLSNVQAGDLIEYTASYASASATNSLFLDVATIVAGSPVNYFGTAGGATEAGIVGWQSTTGTFNATAGSAVYTVQSGDISSGSVTLRLRIRPTTTNARVINANANSPLRVYAKLIPQA